jgi:hypothetical protein
MCKLVAAHMGARGVPAAQNHAEVVETRRW